MTPEIRYAKSGDVHIAYQVFGHGPENLIIIPGFISQSTNVVEHPELISWRIQNFASVVGKENLIAGVDCGFSQYWDQIRCHPSVQWAKLEALSEGAALARKSNS